MLRHVSLLGLALLIIGGFGPARGASPAPARAAEAILKDIDAIKVPVTDGLDRDDRAAVLKFLEARQDALMRRSELIGELYKAAPDNPRLKALFPQRWQALLSRGPEVAADVQREADEVAARAPKGELKDDAVFLGALIALRLGKSDPKAVLQRIDAFTTLAPKDERGAMLLDEAAEGLKDASQRMAVYRRVSRDYPGSQSAERASDTLKQFASVGKPFDLDFTDAISGAKVSLKALRGKVVVIDFWATWCPPCVEEMPALKKLYEEYHDKGVEFVGVSLDNPRDQGGLDDLKRFIARASIPWPQYYQGNGIESEFSQRWHINSVPTMFVVDRNGNLAAVDALGKLEAVIPELLKASQSGATGG